MGDKIVDNLSVAVLGLGEAGAAIARGLASAGVEVRGYDPVAPDVEGVQRADSAAAAASGATLVLSANSAAVALDVARDAQPREGQLYADLNTGPPALKADLARVVEEAGARFVDVGLLGPVPGNGLLTPCLVSGAGAREYAELLRPLGVPVEFVGDEPGLAAERKLLRSVFMKGIAAAAIESLAAARAAGCEEWLHGEIAGVFEGASPAFLDRLLRGSHTHAARRVHEMRAAGEMLTHLDVEPRVSQAALAWLEQLDAEAHVR
jgi:3-hydroxyisobutyrate dehydrogenase-like beta-hydroxyacid dehydrogenase